MDREMPKGLVVALLVGALILSLGLGVILWEARTDKLLEAPALDSGGLVSAGSQVLGSILGNQPTSTANAAALREADRRAVAEAVVRTYLASGALTLVLLVGWTAYAWRQRPKVGGVRAAAIAGAAWYVALLAALAGLGWQMYDTVINANGSAVLLLSSAKASLVGMGALLTILGFYFGTAFGCPPELRASIPLANTVIPLGRSRV